MGPSGGDEYTCGIDFGDGFPRCILISTLIKWYTLNMYSCWHVNHT